MIDCALDRMLGLRLVGLQVRLQRLRTGLAGEWLVGKTGGIREFDRQPTRERPACQWLQQCIFGQRSGLE